MGNLIVRLVHEKLHEVRDGRPVAEAIIDALVAQAMRGDTLAVSFLFNYEHQFDPVLDAIETEDEED
jgi:hypothetical protein